MEIRSWQQKIIDDFPSIIEENQRFILKAPTGAGKTFLASELIKRFYHKKKSYRFMSQIGSFRAIRKSTSPRT